MKKETASSPSAITIPDRAVVFLSEPKAEFSVAITFFILSRLIAHQCGIQFCTKPIEFFWQILPLDLLKTSLVKSLYFLHTQPPLYNLYIGTILQWFPQNSYLVFHAIQVLSGAATVVLMVDLMRRLKMLYGIRILVTVLFICNPAAIGYENWLHYSYFLSFLVTLLLWLLARAISEKKAVFLFLTFLVVATLILSRSLYHPILFVLLAAVSLLFRAFSVRQILIALVFPALLVGSVLVKNMVVFGAPFTSSLLGLSVAYMVQDRLPRGVLESELQAGTITPVSLVPSFGPPETYLSIYPVRPTNLPAAPALDLPRRPDGTPNYNHWVYLVASNQYLPDGLKLLRKYPANYAKIVVKAFRRYCHATTEQPDWDVHNKTIMKSYAKVYNAIIKLTPETPLKMGTILTLIALMTWALVLCLKRDVFNDFQHVFFWMALFMIFFLTSVGVLLDYEEVNYLKYDNEAVVFILNGWLASIFFRRQLYRKKLPNKTESPGI